MAPALLGSSSLSLHQVPEDWLHKVERINLPRLDVVPSHRRCLTLKSIRIWPTARFWQALSSF